MKEEKNLSLTMEVFDYLKKQNKRLISVIIVLTILLASVSIGITTGFLVYLNQFEIVDETEYTTSDIDVHSKDGGNANYINGSGNINN